MAGAMYQFLPDLNSTHAITLHRNVPVLNMFVDYYRKGVFSNPSRVFWDPASHGIVATCSAFRNLFVSYFLTMCMGSGVL